MVEKKRVVYFDVLNILATFLVVWIHFGNEIHWYENSMRWNQACVIQAIAFCAVPIFFMLTGATLLNYRDRYNTKQYFYNRFMRIFIPYLIWGAIFAVWRLSRGEISLCFDSWWQLIYSIINMYVNNTMEPIFWFFAPLFAIYFAIPALTPLSKTENKHVLQYMVWGGVITITIIPFVYNLCALITGSHFYWNGSWQISALGGYLLYAVTGFYLANYELEKKKNT